MKIEGIFQTPISTVLVISGSLPNSKVGNYLKVKNYIYKIIGAPTNDNQTVAIEKATELSVGQEVYFLKNL